MNIPKGIIKIIYKYYPKLLRIELYDKTIFDVTCNGTIIRGTNKCSSYMLYAQQPVLIDRSNDNYKGIYYWSVKNILNIDAGSYCYHSIGIKSIYNESATKYGGGHFYYRNDETCYWYQGYYNNWNYNEILTVKLSYNDWTATFYNGLKEVQKNDIAKNKTYYFAVQLCGKSDFTHFQIVQTPKGLL